MKINKNMNINNKPLVSICIPTYNGEKYIEESLNSALEQTYKNIEIIVSDDASRDNTLQIIEKKLKNSGVVYRIYHNKPNGIGANWNNCVRKAKGDYIKFLFQDDILQPECIEKLIKVALLDKNIGLVFSKREFIYNQKNDFFEDWIEKYGTLHNDWKNLQQVNDGKQLLKNCINLFDTIIKNKVGEPSVTLLNKQIFKKIGFFNESLVQILDYEFWYRVFHKYKIGFIDENLVSFRLHSEQATQKNINNNSDYDIYPKLLYKNIYSSLHPELQKKLFKKYNIYYLNYLKLRKNLSKIKKYIINKIN